MRRLASIVLSSWILIASSFGCAAETAERIADPTPAPTLAKAKKKKPKAPVPPATVSPDPVPTPARERASGPASTVDKSGVVGTIVRVFGSAGMGAVRVADCESGDGPRVAPGPPYHIDPGQISGPHYGAFQINVEIHAARIARLGYSRGDMLRIGPNAVVAHSLFAEQGWQPWTCGWAA